MKPKTEKKSKSKSQPKPKKESRMDGLLKKLNIDDSLSKRIFYKFPTVKSNIFPKSNYNESCDLLQIITNLKQVINGVL